MGLQLIDKYRAGAVHGLNSKVLAVDNGCVHIVMIMLPVTRGLPKRPFHNLRSGNFKITPLLVNLVPIIYKSVSQKHTLGQEERHSGSLVTQCEKSQFSTELSVVSLLCLFDACKMLFKLGSLRESYTVNTLEHFVFLVASPISARAGGKLERLYAAR